MLLHVSELGYLAHEQIIVWIVKASWRERNRLLKGKGQETLIGLLQVVAKTHSLKSTCYVFLKMIFDAVCKWMKC